MSLIMFAGRLAAVAAHGILELIPSPAVQHARERDAAARAAEDALNDYEAEHDGLQPRAQCCCGDALTPQHKCRRSDVRLVDGFWQHLERACSEPAEAPAWADWAVPAICDVLAEAMPYSDVRYGRGCKRRFADTQAWREHVAPLIAERLQSAAPQPK